MNPYFLIITLIALIVGSFAIGRNYERGIQTRERLAEATVHATKLQEATENAHKNRNLVSDLRLRLDRLRVSLPEATCSENSNGASRQLYAAQNRAFRDLQEGDNADFARCDQLNTDAIEVNTITQ
jgi:hypothetical protein